MPSVEKDFVNMTSPVSGNLLIYVSVSTLTAYFHSVRLPEANDRAQ